jgi:hypothetical protein
MNRLQFAIGQFGKRSVRMSSLAMLLDESELPDADWTLLHERSWRTGAGGMKSEEVRAAHRIGTFTAIRLFEHVFRNRWVWIEVMPFASAQDAQSAVPKIRTGLVSNPNATVTVIEERTIEDQEVPGLAHPLVFEQVTTGRNGRGAARYIGGHVDRVLFLVSTSASEAGWPWNEVTSLASLQCLKIQNALNL